jgi:hypothetical protein
MTTQTQSKDAVRGFLAHLESTDNADSLRHLLKTFVAARASVTHQRRRDDEADCRPENAGLVEVRDGGAEDSR